MNYLDSLGDRFPAGEQLYVLLAVIVIVAMLAGYILFFAFSLNPALQARSTLVSQLAEVEQALVKSQYFQQNPLGELALQIGEAQAALDEAAAIFLSESQADQILNQLYLYAGESGVTITDLQTLPVSEEAEKQPYDTRSFQLQVAGKVANLLNFVASIQETAYKGFIISNVEIAAGEEQSVLGMNVTLHTSPYAVGGVGVCEESRPVDISPPPTLTIEEQLTERLHGLWTATNWPEVISVLEQMLALNPGDTEVTEKLYATHVNYGYQLLGEGRPDEAKVEFSQALTIKPGGEEATEGLREIAGVALPSTPEPQPQVTTYTVRQGDTLFSIATRYGVTVEALKAANGLSDNIIKVGQQLIIPAE